MVEDEQIAEGVKEVVEAGKFVRPSLVKVDKLKGSLHFNNYVYKIIKTQRRIIRLITQVKRTQC